MMVPCEVGRKSRVLCRKVAYCRSAYGTHRFFPRVSPTYRKHEYVIVRRFLSCTYKFCIILSHHSAPPRHLSPLWRAHHALTDLGDFTRVSMVINMYVTGIPIADFSLLDNVRQYVALIPSKY